MAYPQFSQPDVTTFVFDQGLVTPEIVDEEARQIVRRAENGTFSTYTLSDALLRHTLTFQDLPAANFAELLTFLRDPLVNYSESEFTYTDAASNDHTVQLVPGTLRRERSATDTYTGSLQLTERL